MTDAQKRLAGSLIGLARSLDETNRSYDALTAMVGGLGALYRGETEMWQKQVLTAKKKAVPDCFLCTHPCGRTSDYDMDGLENLAPALAEAKKKLLEETAIYASTHMPDRTDYQPMLTLLTQALFAVGYDWFDVEEIEKIRKKLI